MVVERDKPWRVFLSHTAELSDHPEVGESYIDAVKRGVSAAGHAIVDMADFPSIDDPPESVCRNRVERCDVYVGIYGTRYGSPVRGREDVSYTELEFEVATNAGIPRLVFRLDTGASDLGIPSAVLEDREFGDRQRAFLDRVTAVGLTTQKFASPAALSQLVERSLRELADTRLRVASGLEREQEAPGPQMPRETKFVNPPPMTAPSYFQDRQVETGLLASFLADPSLRMFTVVGRGGTGKTAWVCRALKGLETGRLPDVDDKILSEQGVDGIVYLARNGVHPIDFMHLYGDLSQLLPEADRLRFEALAKDPARTPERLMLTLLDVFRLGGDLCPHGRVVVLLDNFEDVIDPPTRQITDTALDQALRALLQAPAHAVKVIITTRIAPIDLLELAPATHRRVPFDEGLGLQDSMEVLRDLDATGHLGLHDASDDLLERVWGHTRGFPRALEAVAAILANDATVTVESLLDHADPVAADKVVEVLVGDAFDRLQTESQQVMQAIAVHPAPVSVVGVEFVLQRFNPTMDATPVLKRLVDRQLVRFDAGHYYLHPVDRSYAISQLDHADTEDGDGVTLPGLREQAADYYSEIRTPRDTWRSIEDLSPQLAEFDLRCDNGDYDTAAKVLAEISFDHLRAWGHYRLLVRLTRRLLNQISSRELEINNLNALGWGYQSLGDYTEAVDCYEQALATIDDLLTEATQFSRSEQPQLRFGKAFGQLQAMGATLGNLGVCHYALGNYPAAIDLHERAAKLARDFGDQAAEASALANLGNNWHALGKYEHACDLHEQTLAIARDLEYREGEAMALDNIGACRFAQGDYVVALSLHREALEIAREIGSPYVTSNALTYLGRAYLALREVPTAIDLLEEAATIASTSGNSESAVGAYVTLAEARLHHGEPASALHGCELAHEYNYPARAAEVHLLSAIARLAAHQLQLAQQSFETAAGLVDELLALAVESVDALDTRGLAHSGLAVCGDPDAAAAAAASFGQARAVTTAAGVVNRTLGLFDLIAAHDTEGSLVEVREHTEGAYRRATRRPWDLRFRPGRRPRR